jgi:hypothetical protein
LRPLCLGGELFQHQDAKEVHRTQIRPSLSRRPSFQLRVEIFKARRHLRFCDERCILVGHFFNGDDPTIPTFEPIIFLDRYHNAASILAVDQSYGLALRNILVVFDVALELERRDSQQGRLLFPHFSHILAGAPLTVHKRNGVGSRGCGPNFSENRIYALTSIFQCKNMLP